ncbi:MAG: gliding motility-associated C-terminal domain-containing protein [Saprospiraceae bacterium]|nr:gliding motility-associated C-terminal domain-containing protein [Saprospiraceae bacterium]
MGCDSIVTLILSWAPPITYTYTGEICPGGTYLFNGQTLNTPGTYTANLTTLAGCDSIITLNLVLTDVLETTLDVTICQNEVYIFNGNVVSNTGTYVAELQSSTGCDSIVTLNLTVTFTLVSYHDFTICEGDSLLWRNKYYKETGFYPEQLISANGCDSIVTLVLYAIPVSRDTLVTSICPGENVMFHGTAYSTPGTYERVYQAPSGCDSIFVLELDVHEEYTETFTQAICPGDSVLWNGQYYDTGGIFESQLQTINGCDSIQILELTVMDSPQDTFFAPLCNGDSLVWNGQTYFDAGIFTFVTNSSLGCDSTVILEVVLWPIFQDTMHVTICEGENFQFNGRFLSDSGMYIDTLSTAHGCDSIIVVDLNTIPTYEMEYNTSICEGDSYDFNGTVLSQAGTYADSLQTEFGCDSIILLTLNIIQTTSDTTLASICQGETYLYNGVSYGSSGTYFHQDQSGNGCDSTSVLLLTVQPMLSNTVQAAICPGSSYEFMDSVFTQSGTYTFNLQSTIGCDSMVIFILSEHPPVLPVINGDASICLGDSSHLLLFNVQGTIQWSTGATSTNSIFVQEPGIYSVTVTNVQGCVGSDSFEVTLSPEAVAPVGDEQILDCLDPYTYLGMDPAPEGSYLWTGPSITQATATNPRPYVDEAGWYYLTYTNPSGCSGQDSILVVAMTSPEGADVIVKPTCFGTENGTIEVINIVGGTAPYNITLTGADHENPSPGLFTELSVGSYTVRISDANNCYWDTLIQIIQTAEIFVDLGPDVTIQLGESHHIIPTFSIPVSNISSFIWDPTTWLSCTECLDPFASPIENTTYTLTIYDLNGCPASDEIEIRVDSRANIFIPDIFSPNGDNINDVFMIFTDPGVKRIVELKIYDRWGEKVFELDDFLPNDPLFGWDGNFKGKPMNPAVFVYYTYAELINGRIVFLKGDVTLYR